MGTPATFSLRVAATAPAGSENFAPGQRVELIVIARDTLMDDAIGVVHQAIAEAGWMDPDVRQITQIPGKMTLAKLRLLNRQPGVAAAIRYGQAIIVFPET